MDESGNLIQIIEETVRVGYEWTPLLKKRIEYAIWCHDRELVRTARGQSRTTNRVIAWIKTHEDVDATHEEIANDIFCQRETVTRCMKKLVDEGRIIKKRSKAGKWYRGSYSLHEVRK